MATLMDIQVLRHRILAVLDEGEIGGSARIDDVEAVLHPIVDELELVLKDEAVARGYTDDVRRARAAVNRFYEYLLARATYRLVTQSAIRSELREVASSLHQAMIGLGEQTSVGAYRLAFVDARSGRLLSVESGRKVSSS